jgi:hypothetical protein
MLRELNGMPSEEVADRVGLTTEQVEQALFAARNRLAEHLSFGGRADCDTVRSTADAPLAPREQRALKAHLRACTACRVALTKAKVGLFSNLGLWGRQAAQWLLSGGAAPVTAKIGVVVATTAFGAVAAPTAIHSVERALSQPQSALAAAPLAAPAGSSQALELFGRSVPTLLGTAATPPGAQPGGGVPFDPGGPASAQQGAGDTTQTDQSATDNSGTTSDTTSGDTTPVDDTAPVDETPPPDTTPVDTTPVDTTPVDTTPVDTTPVDTTPVDTTPVDTTPVHTTPTP